MMLDSDLEALVKRVIALYNRIRSPKVTVKLVFLAPPLLTVEFSGGICYECSTLEYTEGFAQQFKMLTTKYELKTGKTRQINPRTFQTDFSVKSR